MRFSSSPVEPATANIPSLFSSSVFLALSILLSTAHAIHLTPVVQPDLDLKPLGRVALTGSFDAISLYQFEEQRPNNHLPNGTRSQSLLTALPNGALATLASADADILSLCPLMAENGTITDVVVGGNFTSLGGVESQGIALFNMNSNHVTPISNLSGKVLALLCDNESGIVYVGGDFKTPESSNAVIWSPSSGFSSLPFAGFNGPVSSITKTRENHIVFGGSFDGLGNATTPALKDQQVINLDTSRISAGSSTTNTDYSNPRNIICKQFGQGNAGNPWLLTDNSPGYWRADMKFGYQPTKLRLYNTHLDGRGTKTFHFTAVPDNGILNMTYTDPATGDIKACDSQCPLSDDPSEKYRDFTFVNQVGVSGFQLDISEWYGQGAGLDGLELFQDDIYTYAVDDFNEPKCARIPFGSSSSATGSWQVTPSRHRTSDYLIAQVASTDQTPTSVTFMPDIKQSGNYSVTVFTPGCLQDNTCDTRGMVDVTWSVSSNSDRQEQTVIYQTNNFDKYDQIFLGFVDVSSSNFRPTVKLTTKAGQQNIHVVASRVRFELISSTGGLNGLYEFDPEVKETSVDFSKSAINRAGMDLDPGALVTSLAFGKDILFIAGNFSSSSFSNIMSITDGKTVSLPDGGLNSQVNSVLLLEDSLFVGGNFSSTLRGTSESGKSLSNVAAYSLSKKAWGPLGAGVDGRVESVVYFSLNLTDNKPEPAVAFSGNFSHILPFDKYPLQIALGFAVWVPSRQNWLQNLDVSQSAFIGELTTSLMVKNVTTLFAGSLMSGGLLTRGAVALTDNKGLGLQPLPVNIESMEASSSLQKPLAALQDVPIVTTGLFYNRSGRNLTILAGHFSAKGENDATVNNLLFMDGSRNNAITGTGSGIDTASTFLTMGFQGDSLFAGGIVTGSVSGSNISGLVAYDLQRMEYQARQPAALEGDGNVVVSSIAPRPESTDVYVGGQFESVGGLPCPAVCNYQPASNQWTRVGNGIQGNVSVLKWANKDKLIVAGNFTVANNQTTLATFDATTRAWSSISGATSDVIPGPVTALGLAREDGSRFWVAGKSSDGSPFLVFYDGSKFLVSGSLFEKQSTIYGIQVLGVRKNHLETTTLDKDQVLFISGKLEIPVFGSASGALYNGTTLTPFVLSTKGDGQPGIVTELFSENRNTFRGGRRPHSRGIVILVSFCIALGCVFLIVLIGIILNRIQRRRQGYVVVPRGTDRRPDLQRIPPEHLLDSLRRRTSGVPVI
ncbi:hypothetical protein PABG_06288 [Paracoccidioides brasiliensis Pb03]|nr:hypothetical protein PABG_06288 [Paracoccidioides brasiliensis Pb03]